MSGQPRIRVIGGGLAGPEAALTAARLGVAVDLYEMRPVRTTPAHQTADFGELVCSNSLKSESEHTAPWLLKQEMRRAGSALLACADASAVPAGHALAVDRVEFSRRIAEAIVLEPLITVHREEVTTLDPEAGITVIASGPLTSSALSDEIARLTGAGHLAFYDSISPIVETDSIDMSKVYYKARWDKGSADYINCPMNREEYDRFYDALVAAEHVEEKDWEKLPFFEACLPIEELARRGRDTPRYGPMKPVGLRDPRTDTNPWAVVQLRSENLRADSYNLVGFQNHLKFGEQARILRMIPGLENAKFLRYGQIHRNTYINAPSVLAEGLHLRAHPKVFFAGQISGVEGYTESIATGLLAGLYAASAALGVPVPPVPRVTALGSLVHYITHAEAKHFQPANITFDLLQPLDEATRKRIRDKRERHRLQCEQSLAAFDGWWSAWQQHVQRRSRRSGPMSASAIPEARPRAVICLSGGMDSTVCAALAARHYEPCALHFSYGQRTEARELRAAREAAALLGIEQFLHLSIDLFRRIGGSALTDASIAVPEGEQAIGSAIPVTYVPFRNAHFLSAAVSWAEVLDARAIFIGAVEQDSSGYPDCRPAYYEAFQQLIRAGTRDGDITVETPLIHLRKREIIRLGVEAGAPLHVTWSCYQGSDVACGVCDSCVLRLRAFAEAGVEDVLPYATRGAV